MRGERREEGREGSHFSFHGIQTLTTRPGTCPFLMYNVMMNKIGYEGGVALGSFRSQADTADTEVAVTGEIHLL